MPPEMVWLMYAMATVACLWGTIVAWMAWWLRKTYTWFAVSLITTWTLTMTAALVIQRSPYSPDNSWLESALRDIQRWFLWSLPFLCLWLIAHRISVENGNLRDLERIARAPLIPFILLSRLVLKKVGQAAPDENPPNEQYLR